MRITAQRQRLIDCALAELGLGARVLSHHVGCSSSTLKVASGGQQFALRVRVAANHSDLRREFRLQWAAARRGCAPRPLRVVPPAKSIISEWAPGKTAASTIALRSRAPALVGRALARQHGGELSGRRAGDIVRFLIAATESETRPYAGFFDLARRAANQLESSRTRLAPIHGDLWPANVIVSDRQCLLIDWECAGDGDPASDLACYSVGATLDRAEEASLIGAYFGVSGGRHGSSSMADRMVLWKRVIAAVWLAWASTLTDQHHRRRWMAWALERAEHQIMLIV